MTRTGYAPARVTLETHVDGEPYEITYQVTSDGAVYRVQQDGMRRVKDLDELARVGLRLRRQRLEHLASIYGWALPPLGHLPTIAELQWVEYWTQMEAWEAIRAADPEAKPPRPLRPHTPGRSLPTSNRPQDSNGE